MATIGGFPQKDLNLTTQRRPMPLLSPNPPSTFGVDGLSDLGYPLDLGLMPPGRSAKPPSDSESLWKTGPSKFVTQAVGFFTAAASFIGTAGLAIGIAGLSAHLANEKHR